jgi:hypothetical protein
MSERERRRGEVHWGRRLVPVEEGRQPEGPGPEAEPADPSSESHWGHPPRVDDDAGEPGDAA